jgi:hypothetical protein
MQVFIGCHFWSAHGRVEWDVLLLAMIYSTTDQRPSHWTVWTAHPAVWFGLAVIFLAADYYAGPTIQFPIAFIFPVALAAWHGGIRWGLFFALCQPVARFAFNLYWDAPWPMMVSIVNLLIRIAVLCSFAWLVAYTVRQRRRIAALEGLLPVCAWCRRIRDEQNSWQSLDSYLVKRAELDVTHGICPDCQSKHFPENAEA